MWVHNHGKIGGAEHETDCGQLADVRSSGEEGRKRSGYVVGSWCTGNVPQNVNRFDWPIGRQMVNGERVLCPVMRISA